MPRVALVAESPLASYAFISPATNYTHWLGAVITDPYFNIYVRLAAHSTGKLRRVIGIVGLLVTRCTLDRRDCWGRFRFGTVNIVGILVMRAELIRWMGHSRQW